MIPHLAILVQYQSVMDNIYCASIALCGKMAKEDAEDPGSPRMTL